MHLVYSSLITLTRALAFRRNEEREREGFFIPPIDESSSPSRSGNLSQSGLSRSVFYDAQRERFPTCNIWRRVAGSALTAIHFPVRFNLLPGQVSADTSPARRV